MFGDLDVLDAELERYLRGTTFPTSLLNADRIKASTDVATRALTVGENAILPYRMSSANGVNDKTAGPLADRARPVAARYPSEPFVQRAMAEMEYDVANATRKDGQFDVAALARAEAAADRTLALDPNNVMGLVYKGRVAALRAVQSKDINQWRNARRLFLRANQLSPDYALPFQLFYDTFVAAGQLPTEGAVTGMRRAVVLVPADTSLRVRMGIEMIRLGELGLARHGAGTGGIQPPRFGKEPLRQAGQADGRRRQQGRADGSRGGIEAGSDQRIRSAQAG